MQKQVDDEQRTAVRSAQIDADRSEFSGEVATVFDQQVRPPRQAILERSGVC